MSDVALEVINSDPDTKKRLEALSAKVEAILNEVAVASGVSFDVALEVLVQRQQATQQRRAEIRVRYERELLDANREKIDAEVERVIAEGK